ncbi:MAG TPA: radical SAM protein, partial [Polyangiaceae bacterium]
MKTLLVHPAFPKTYWGMEYARLLSRRAALLPPLGLLTVAALLPADWEVKLLDMSIEPLRDEDLNWADVVFVGAMQIQKGSFHEVIRRAHVLNKAVVVGGAYPTTEPDSVGDADSIVIGESEELIATLCSDLEQGRLQSRYRAKERPSVARSPVPRFDLLRVGAYQSIGVQFSRGCPFNCEFCDIIGVFGRVPRTKSPEQLMRELDAVHATGFHGMLFLVDDNFIGNKRAAKRMLPVLANWMRARRFPFDIYTEASINLAADDELVGLMVEAGFSSVFIGIETPSSEALAETHKIQNLKLDLTAAVEKLTGRGLEVMAGFIVGFDADDEGIFERQHQFIQAAPIPLAMVGLLSALPGSQLWDRLLKEGRLFAEWSGETFGRTNFKTRLPE